MASEPNQNLGRQKIEIKKVEHHSRRHVTFSKRKLGLFNKAAELAILSNAEIAVVVFSQNDKVFAFGNPNPDVVVDRYLSRDRGSSLPVPVPVLQQRKKNRIPVEKEEDTMVKQQYLAALSMLEKEKKLLETLKEKKVTAAANGEGTSVGCWWEQGIERMGLEELEPLKEALEALKENVKERAENMTRIQPPSTAAATSFVALLNGDVSEDQELAW